MKNTLRRLVQAGLLFAGIFSAGQLAAQQTISFSYTLDEPCKTSAGVFAADGTLVRTLWSKTRNYAAGTNSAVWDGLDDASNAAPAGTYQIKLLQHNTEYVWDGAVGNTSAELSGPTVHRGFYPMRDMAIAGTNGFYVSGYNEGMYDFRSFSTTDPQHVKIAWGADDNPANIFDPTWNWTATDGNRVYFACSAATNPTNTSVNNFPGFIVTAQVGAASPPFSASFSQGTSITYGSSGGSYPNGIYVGAQPGLSGLAVQQTGNLLAASVAPDNRIYLMDKQSGAAISSFSVNAPGRMNFSPDGSLWVISGNNVCCYTNITSSPSLAVTISNFSEPLDVAVNPTNGNLILVADGAASQQVKAFNSAGASLWTYGLAGGYQTNGAAVAANKFWFNDGEGDGTFLCFAADGSFWVGDGGNHRSLHFSAGLSYIDQIMYQPHSYMACVDQNNPSRVFNQFLEFSVDYTKPLPQAWTLVNNWKVNVPDVNISWNEGLYEVTTFTNGRTYGLIDNNTSQFPMSELFELTTNQLRLTGLYPAYNNPRGWISLGPDGSAYRTTIGSATWYRTTLSGFDTNNNPIYNPETLLASAPEGDTDPVPRGESFGNIRATISSNNILISFDQSLNNGYHLGGIKLGTTNWLWKASPAIDFMNGLGTYEIDNGVVYAGNTVQAVDRNVVYGYHGEFFRNAGQAGQHMHFYDDGLFVGQFGEANVGHSAYEGALPGSAGNGHCPSLVKANGDYYLWVNDESSHGPQRWHFVNGRNIREQTGSGTLGSSITLTNQPFNFPTGVTGQNGNQSAQLSWLPVPGATSYNIRYSTANGGPYTTLAGNTASPTLVIGGLTNGQTYFCVVSAIQSGVEGALSDQVPVTPFDTTQSVLTAGSMTEGGQGTPVIDIVSAAPALGQPSYTTAEHTTGLLNVRELDYYGYGNLVNETIGTKGYWIFNWQGAGIGLTNFIPPLSIDYVPGWATAQFLERQFRVDGTLGITDGMVPNPVNSLDIVSTDTNYHYLTVISPDEFNFARQFTMRLTSTNNTSVAFNVNESPGLSHVFQFLFKGNVTLTADDSGNGAQANVQALFLDDAPVTFAAPGTSPVIPVPPTSYEVAISNDLPVARWKLNEKNVNPASGSAPAFDFFGGFTGTYGANTLNGGSPTPIVGPTPPIFPGFATNEGAVETFTGEDNSYVTVPPLNLNTNTITCTMWVHPNSIAAQNTGLMVCRGGTTVAGFGFCNPVPGMLGYNWDNELETYNWASGVTPPVDTWSFVAWVITPTNATIYQLNTNGLTVGSIDNTHILEAFDAFSTIGSDSFTNSRTFDGDIADVAIFNQALSESQVIALFTDASGGLTFPPQIVQQPLSPTLYAGQNLRLLTAVSGNSPFFYQWLTNNGSGAFVPIDAGMSSSNSSSTLVVSNVSSATPAQYELVVSNVYGAVTSSVATLTVVTPGAISSFESSVASNQPIAFWRLDETNADPATGTALAFDYYGGLTGSYGSNTLNGGSTPPISGPPSSVFPGFVPDLGAVETFSGVTNAGVTVPALWLTGGRLSCSMWINPSASEPPGTALFFCRGGTTVAGFSYCNLAANVLGYTWANDFNTYDWNSGISPPIGMWSFVTWVVTPTNVTLTLMNTNGTNSANFTYPNPFQVFDAPSMIGSDPFSDSRTFAGEIAHVALFSQPLTSDQIQGLYASAFVPPSQSPHDPLPNQPVSLQILMTPDGGVAVSWPVAAGAYVLQVKSGLTTTSWANVTNTPTVISGTNTVTLPATSSSQFFRLGSGRPVPQF